MKLSRITLVAAFTALIAATTVSARAQDDKETSSDPPVVVTDDQSEADATQGDATGSVRSGQDRVQVRLYELRWNAPYLGTDRWASGDYGLGVGLEVPLAAHGLKSISPFLVYTWTNLGFDGTPGIGNFLKAGTTLNLDGHWGVSATIDGLLASVSGSSYWDAVLGASWLEQPTTAPWKGWYVDAAAMTGTNSDNGWLISRFVAQWNWHLIPDSFMIVPLGSLVVSWLPGTPLQRLPIVQAGYGFLPNDFVAGSLPDGKTCLSAGVISVRTKISLALPELLSGSESSSRLRLNMTAGPWVGGLNLLRNNQDYSFAWDSGLVAGIGLAMDTTTRAHDTVTRTISPIVTIELQAPFSTILRMRTWRISLLTFLDPSELIRM